MPQIKHIAIATNDAEKTAKFYSESSASARSPSWMAKTPRASC